MSAKVEIGYRSQSYGYVESDGDTIYCSGPRSKIIKLLIERISSPDDEDADAFLDDLPRRLDGRFWARAVEHLVGQHDQSSHGNQYGTDENGNRKLLTPEDILSQKYPHTKFNLSYVDPAARKGMAKHIDTLFKAYPDVAKSIVYIGHGEDVANPPSFEDGTMALARRVITSGEHSIFLNRDVFEDAKYGKYLLEESAKTGWLASDGSLESIVTHEFGHCVDYYLRGGYNHSLFGMMGEKGDGTVSNIVDEFKKSNEELGSSVSRYANHGGPVEAWAEAFSSGYHGKPGPYAKAQKALLAQILPSSKWKFASRKEPTSEQLAKREQFYRKYVHVSSHTSGQGSHAPKQGSHAPGKGQNDYLDDD